MATCLPVLLIAVLGTFLMASVDGDGHTHHRKIIIHVPHETHINHHTRTIYKHIYHKAKKENKEPEHKEVEHKEVEYKEEKHHGQHEQEEHFDHGHHEHHHQDHHDHVHHEEHHHKDHHDLGHEGSYEEIGYTYGKPYIPFKWEEEKKETPKKYSHHHHISHHKLQDKKDPKLFSTYVSDFTNKFYDGVPHTITSYGNHGFKGHSESGLGAYN